MEVVVTIPDVGRPSLCPDFTSVGTRTVRCDVGVPWDASAATTEHMGNSLLPVCSFDGLVRVEVWPSRQRQNKKKKWTKKTWRWCSNLAGHGGFRTKKSITIGSNVARKKNPENKRKANQTERLISKQFRSKQRSTRDVSKRREFLMTVGSPN